jgi:F-type H+-transporting ATPase subunit b
VQKEVDAQRKALEDQLAGRLAEAEKQIAATKMKALENVRAIATDAATDIVAQLLGDKPDTKAVEAAVEASLKN